MFDGLSPVNHDANKVPHSLKPDDFRLNHLYHKKWGKTILQERDVRCLDTIRQVNS